MFSVVVSPLSDLYALHWWWITEWVLSQMLYCDGCLYFLSERSPVTSVVWIFHGFNLLWFTQWDVYLFYRLETPYFSMTLSEEGNVVCCALFFLMVLYFLLLLRNDLASFYLFVFDLREQSQGNKIILVCSFNVTRLAHTVHCTQGVRMDGTSAAIQFTWKAGSLSMWLLYKMLNKEFFGPS